MRYRRLSGAETKMEVREGDRREGWMEIVNKKEEERSGTIPIVKENPY